VEQCPLTKIKDELLLAFTAGKAELVDEGKVPPAVRDCLTKLQKYGNPYGISRKKRTDWTGDAEIEIFSDQEFLFFPGDGGAFDSRGQEITRSVVALLTRLGVSLMKG
jgi:Fe-S oxidoreductase